MGEMSSHQPVAVTSAASTPPPNGTVKKIRPKNGGMLLASRIRIVTTQPAPKKDGGEQALITKTVVYQEVNGDLLNLTDQYGQQNQKAHLHRPRHSDRDVSIQNKVIRAPSFQKLVASKPLASSPTNRAAQRTYEQAYRTPEDEFPVPRKPQTEQAPAPASSSFSSSSTKAALATPSPPDSEEPACAPRLTQPPQQSQPAKPATPAKKKTRTKIYARADSSPTLGAHYLDDDDEVEEDSLLLLDDNHTDSSGAELDARSNQTMTNTNTSKYGGARGGALSKTGHHQQGRNKFSSESALAVLRETGEVARIPAASEAVAAPTAFQEHQSLKHTGSGVGSSVIHQLLQEVSDNGAASRSPSDNLDAVHIPNHPRRRRNPIRSPSHLFLDDDQSDSSCGMEEHNMEAKPTSPGRMPSVDEEAEEEPTEESLANKTVVVLTQAQLTTHGIPAQNEDEESHSTTKPKKTVVDLIQSQSGFTGAPSRMVNLASQVSPGGSKKLNPPKRRSSSARKADPNAADAALDERSLKIKSKQPQEKNVHKAGASAKPTSDQLESMEPGKEQFDKMRRVFQRTQSDAALGKYTESATPTSKRGPAIVQSSINRRSKKGVTEKKPKRRKSDTSQYGLRPRDPDQAHGMVRKKSEHPDEASPRSEKTVKAKMGTSKKNGSSGGEVTSTTGATTNEVDGTTGTKTIKRQESNPTSRVEDETGRERTLSSRRERSKSPTRDRVESKQARGTQGSMTTEEGSASLSKSSERLETRRSHYTLNVMRESNPSPSRRDRSPSTRDKSPPGRDRILSKSDEPDAAGQPVAREKSDPPDKMDQRRSSSPKSTSHHQSPSPRPGSRSFQHSAGSTLKSRRKRSSASSVASAGDSSV